MDDLEGMTFAIRASELRLEELKTHLQTDPDIPVVGLPCGLGVWFVNGGTAVTMASQATILRGAGDETLLDAQQTARAVYGEEASLTERRALLEQAIAVEEVNLKCLQAVLGQMLKAAGASEATIIRWGGKI